MAKITVQKYPRISDERDEFEGYLDEGKLNRHIKKLSKRTIKAVVESAIKKANLKSGRTVLAIPEGLSEETTPVFYKKKGAELFNYFRKYCGDPASSAYACNNRNYRDVAIEQFRNWTLQKERMNSGWRYQFIAKDAAGLTQRFTSISDIGTAEADFNATIGIKDTTQNICIYVSVKNRVSTMGGQDWPKAIHALENVAKNDKNRTGAYICVFGIAMEKGLRTIKNDSKTGTPHSFNTELWKSDFFWPFFTNLSYDEIVKAVLDVLVEKGESIMLDIHIPDLVITTFGEYCMKYGLVDEFGKFNDPYKLVDFFCGKLIND